MCFFDIITWAYDAGGFAKDLRNKKCVKTNMLATLFQEVCCLEHQF